MCLAALLFLTACGEVTPMATVPDAENSLITSEGRLFVTGSFNLYEITKNAEGVFESHPVLDEAYYFAGIDEYKGFLFTLRNGKGLNMMLKPDPVLVIAPLSDLAPEYGPRPSKDLFTEIPLDGMSMPNGLAIDARGHLFISDTLGGKIHRFTLSPDDPEQVDGPYDCALSGLMSPNGLVVDCTTLYITDLGSVKKADILADGYLGPVKTLFSGRVMLDDLTVFKGTLVVADYMGGTIFQLSPQGKILRETKMETFAFPSSVNIGTGPMFETGDIVVTEKGVLYEPNTAFGNRVVLFHVDAP